MANTLVESLSYPWHSQEAQDFHQALYRAVTFPTRIELLYAKCGAGLMPLNTQGPPDIIWKQALESLVAARKLQVFCDLIAKDPSLKSIAPYVPKAMQQPAAATRGSSRTAQSSPEPSQPNELFEYDVFLSHTGKDKSTVRTLAENLHDAELRVWFDEWIIRPGDDIFLTIERGLQAARVQVLCLSPAALGSDWLDLERSTVLFRDPSNKQRRFVPLLLADCNLPDTLRRYKYIDYRDQSEAALAQLVAACR